MNEFLDEVSSLRRLVYVWLWLLSVVAFLRLFHVQFHHHAYIGAFFVERHFNNPI